MAAQVRVLDRPWEISGPTAASVSGRAFESTHSPAQVWSPSCGHQRLDTLGEGP